MADNSEQGSLGQSSGIEILVYFCHLYAYIILLFLALIWVAFITDTYPPLPPIDEIDFKTLREEAEWCLLYNYVYTFPSLVEQTIEYLEDTCTILANIHTHKVSQMLCSLSRSLSSYYSRFHVLGEPRLHLLPTMYARIYLLKAVHQVMENGFALMGIQPLSQL